MRGEQKERQLSTETIILVVEDDADIRNAIAEILVDEGYTVRIASHGAEGLDELRRKPSPNLVLLDLMMPVMTGWQMRSEQLADPTLCDIPVAVITADAYAKTRNPELAANAFLVKPVDLEQLITTVDSLLPASND